MNDFWKSSQTLLTITFSPTNVGAKGLCLMDILASSGVLSAFFRLHLKQEVTRLCQSFLPPRDFGITWSKVRCFDDPQ